MPLTRIPVGRLSVESKPEDEETARVIADACDGALGLARECWGLDPPSDCRLCVMTSWRRFIFEAAPWPWKITLALAYPAWSGRARRTWPYSAGWTQRFGHRIAIGIKPPHLLERSDKSVGVHLFVEETDPIARIRHLTCHELTHAATAHLALPAWLNEGLATITVDRFMGRATIRDETLDLVLRTRPKGPPPSYRAMARQQGEVLAYHAIRGYWIVRFLEETHPGFLRSLLAARQAHPAIEGRVAGRLGLKPAELWREIDDLVGEHFRRKRSATI